MRLRRIFFSVALVSFVGISTAKAAEFTARLSRTDGADASPGDSICADATGICTLRAAVDETNALPGPDVIRISGSDTAGTVPLEIVITGDLEIVGAGMSASKISGIQINRLFRIAAGVSVQVRDLTLAGGQAVEGGIVLNEGTLLLERVMLTRGIAQRGGAAFNLGNLTIRDSYVYQHISQALGAFGGAIYNAATLRIERTTVAKGQAVLGCGGGIYNAVGATADIINTTLFKNIARKGSGAAICNDGIVRCTNCTIARNRATIIGGGVLNQTGTAELLNTVLSGNTAAQQPDTGNCGGLPTISLGHNLDSAGMCGFGGPGDLGPADPGLRDIAPIAGYPVPIADFKGNAVALIDAGTNSGCPATDQLGRPRPVGGSCDIGALEHPAPAVTPTPVVTDTPVPTSTPTVVPGTATATPSITATPTETSTPSPTISATPTLTATYTSTPLAPGEFYVDFEAADHGDANVGDGVCANSDGVCSLRAAVEEANSSPYRDTIYLPVGLVKLRGELLVTGDMDILGSGMHESLIVTSNLPLARTLHIVETGSIRLSNLTLADGFAEYGGVIYNKGNLTITHCRIASGMAEHGAGLYNLGTADIADSFFDGHTDTPPAGLGGCIHNRGTLTLTRVTLKRGQSRLGCGGGIYNAAPGVVDAVNLTVMRNRSRRARAGGICNDGGTVRCTNCTIARNQANNTSGGILNLAGTIELRNTMLVDNFNGGVGRGANCSGAGIVSLGHNIDSGSTCGFSAPGDMTDINPGIRALHVLGGDVPVGVFDSPDSVAIDAADPMGCPATDGRGAARPSGLGCDIGAYEYQFE